MKSIALIVSLTALAFTIVPPLLYFYGQMALDTTKLSMLVAALAWFATAPVWMDRR